MHDKLAEIADLDAAIRDAEAGLTTLKARRAALTAQAVGEGTSKYAIAQATNRQISSVQAWLSTHS